MALEKYKMSSLKDKLYKLPVDEVKVEKKKEVKKKKK